MTTVSLQAVPPPADHDIQKAQSRRLEIDYQVNESALPLTRVELWYTRDGGETWHNFGLDEDRQSPIQFDAAEEGLYGFCFLLENKIGSSGDPPQPGTTPQQWCFVDYTPPIVQLHAVHVEQRDSLRPRLQIRWTAIDGHFDPRPIELSYRIAPDGEWARFAERLSNTGRYDWFPPEPLEGRVVVRLTARDRSGHRVSAVARAVELVRTAAGDETTPPTGEVGNDEQPADAMSKADRKRAETCFRRGLIHKERGEYRVAAARFQDALAINPRMPEALVNLGETLYFREQYAESIESFQWATKLEPGWTEARRGLVRSLMVIGHYEDASAQLARILSDAPEDAQAWLTLGDVSMSRGDELMARDNWQKAATVDPKAEDVIERATARLESLRRGTVVAGVSGR